MSNQSQIYQITSEVLEQKQMFEYICSNMQNSYYWSDDFSQSFYIQLASAGFISTTYDREDGLILLPELQFDYAVLDFENLHISKKIKKLISIDTYTFCINTRFDEVLECFCNSHENNWLKQEYATLLKDLYLSNSKNRNFKVISVELISKQNDELIAGEVGYVIGKTYTSLSGFSSKDKKYNNYGTLQLVLLSKYLEEKGFKFWNLGHANMEYKTRLGAKIYSRAEFLKRWEKDVISFIIY